MVIFNGSNIYEPTVNFAAKLTVAKSRDFQLNSETFYFNLRKYYCQKHSKFNRNF